MTTSFQICEPKDPRETTICGRIPFGELDELRDEIRNGSLRFHQKIPHLKASGFSWKACPEGSFYEVSIRYFDTRIDLCDSKNHIGPWEVVCDEHPGIGEIVLLLDEKRLWLGSREEAKDGHEWCAIQGPIEIESGRLIGEKSRPNDSRPTLFARMRLPWITPSSHSS